MTREEMLACLTDRPCNVCKFHAENGCAKWSCVFEEKPDDEENKGEWIPKERPTECSIDMDVVCSRCGHVGIEGYAHGYELDELPKQEMKDYIKKFDMNFCPCCGADMRGGSK